MLNNLPGHWDDEVDFIAVGSGIGGLSGAIAAHEQGLSAIVLEKTDKLGGVTALSMGEVWVPGNAKARAIGVEDSAESGYRYVRQLSMGYGEDALILNQVVHAAPVLDWFEERIGLRLEPIRNCPDYYRGHSNDAVPEGRLLEPVPFRAETLGAWQESTRVSPQVPYGLTHEDIYAMGGTCNLLHWDYTEMARRLSEDERCLGPALAAYFVKGALDRDIVIQTGADVQELIADGTQVCGVRYIKDGRDHFVKARRGVLVAVSSYDRNPELTRTLGPQLEPESMVTFGTVDGAHFRLTGPLGARIARMPDVTMLGYNIPGEETDEGTPMWRGGMTFIGLPHTIVVNRAGKRFANEGFYRSIYYAVDAIDGGTQTHPNFPAWAILDAQARAKYPLGSIMPGQDVPEEVAVKADSLAELASLTGIDRDGLEATVARFNDHAERGEDPDFNRHAYPWGAWLCGDASHKPHPNLGPLLKPPFYALKFKRLTGSAIASTGVVIDRHARAVGWDGQAIPGLYLAGNSAARLDMGALVQSGMSNARGMTQGWLAGHHAAGKASTLLDEALAELEEREPV